MPRHELFPAPLSTCPYCGAGRNNGNRHSGNCLAKVAELDGSYDKNRRAWRSGAELALKTGGWGRARLPITNPRDKAQEMGALCALDAIKKDDEATQDFIATLKDPKWRLGLANRGAA